MGHPAAGPLRLILPALACLAGTTLAQNPLPKVSPLPRTISASQQFVIYEDARIARSRLAQRAEDLKKEWLGAIRQIDDWHHPIVIYVHPEPRSRRARVETQVYESDGGALKIQVDVNDRAALGGTELDMEILRAVLLEAIYRDIPLKAGRSFVQPPAWLISGLWEALRSRQEGVASGLYRHLIEQGNVLELEAFLKQRPEMLDATSRAIYRAESLALLRALLDVPDGGGKLAGYVTGLSRYGPTDTGALLAAFPDFNRSSRELTKRWILNLARGSAADRIKPMRVEESDKQLVALLDFREPADRKNPAAGLVAGPNAMPLAARAEGGRFVMQEKVEQLLRLEMRVHPLYRPVVEEYRLLATELARKPKKNLSARLAKIDQFRVLLVRHSGGISDYMNWFEASRLDTPSGEFAEIIEPDGGPIGWGKRSDDISRYLDGIAEQGW